MAVSKVIYGGNTLIDLTGDTVTASTLIRGVTATNAAGQKITGTAVIPTKTSELTNDSGFITASDNTASATVLETAREIDGIEFDGSADVNRYAVCSTEAGTNPKVVTVPNFKLVTGACVRIRFTVANTYTSPTLNVSGTGAKQIRYHNSALSTSTTRAYLGANRTYEFVYDGTYWQIVGDVDTNTNNATAQNISTADDTYPILLGNTANATANIGNKATLFGAGIKANPATSEITAEGFIGDLTGNADTATKATQDASGNVITTTYATKAEIPTVPTDVSAFANDAGYITGITSSDITVALGFTPANSATLSGYVPTTRTVNGKALSSDISLTASDVGAVTSSDLAGYLPLSGGTMSGTVRFTNGSAISETENVLRIGATSSAEASGGARLQLYQRDKGGYFNLGAVTDNGVKTLIGRDTGSLQWGGTEISRMGMPVSGFTSLTLPSNGGTVTAPYDGYISLLMNSTASGQFVRLDNNGNYASSYSSGSGQNLAVTLPVAKGSVVTVRYTAAGTTQWFRFKRAVGAAWEE